MDWQVTTSATTLARRRGYLCMLILASLCTQRLLGQAPTTSTSQLQAIELQARSALLTGAQPTSIVLDGTFTSTAGSLSQTGNANLTVGSDGSFAFNLSRTKGTIAESRTVSDGNPSCTWTDQENVVHNANPANCTPPAWFFPGLTLLSTDGDPSLPAWNPSSYSSDSLGDHLQFQFVIPASLGTLQGPPLAKPFELVLASDTHLPSYSLYSARPDSPSSALDIQVRIAYSDYRNVSGVMIPFHIQRFVNGSLVLDLAINTASVQ